jgi:hypothetical protein
MNKSINIKSVIPCISIHPFIIKYGVQIANTCVGVAREKVFFDFPTNPQDVYVLVLTEALKGSYKIRINIVNENFSQIITGEEAEIEFAENTLFNLVFRFKNAIFQNEGLYFFKILIDGLIVFSYDFPVLKVMMPQDSPENTKNILDDPETVKKSSITLECECGHRRTFSIALDPKEQIDNERIPENKIYQCENCKKEHNLNEISSQMRFYLGSKNIIDTINSNLGESRILARSGFYNSALVIQISAFEAFLRDSFVSSYKNWFKYLIDEQDGTINTIRAKKEIAKIIKEYGLTDKFYERLILFGRKQLQNDFDELLDYNENLKILLFGDEEENGENQRVPNIINFQQLKGSTSGLWAYSRFFGISIQNKLNQPKKGYYEHLQKSFKIRHQIIHAPSKLPNGMVVTPEMLQNNQDIILLIRNFINEELLKIKRDGL